MKIITILYILVLIIYIIYGYNICSKIYLKENLDIFSLNSNNKCFIMKRILQLSLITLLVSAISCENLDINIYMLAFILNLVVVVFYYANFSPIEDKLTYFFHILWALPIFLLPFFYEITGEINFEYIFIIFVILLLYKLFLQNYVYS